MTRISNGIEENIAQQHTVSFYLSASNSAHANDRLGGWMDAANSSPHLRVKKWSDRAISRKLRVAPVCSDIAWRRNWVKMAPRLVLCVFFVSVGSLAPVRPRGRRRFVFSDSSGCIAQYTLKAVDCLRVNLSSCMSFDHLKEAADFLIATRDSSCSPVMSQDVNQCITKLQQCQLLLQPLSDPEDIDPCSTQTPVDACAISSKAVDCLRVNLSSCMSISQVKDLVNTLTATRDQSCSPGNVCQQKLSLCACDLKKVQPDGGEVNSESVALVCSAFSDFQACIADCADDPNSRSIL
ncbi:uncharacterized protein LOC112559867 isoform X2 [Pomacea canaliculata]|uniref:uncharacterized protein LOC112559867 isoform X2 n=1 Tax=Pomacea canaliculata TaxID=400727 RepID=UPI000D7273B2|nr:uncharacterized protein LOC112559867 isoform X2 [Pomacea canaliculata]